MSILSVMIYLGYMLRSRGQQIDEAMQNNATLERENAILGERLAAMSDKYTTIISEREELLTRFNDERTKMAEQFSDKFNILANNILEQKSRNIALTGKEQLESILKPFGENIERFRLRVEEEAKHRFALENEVKRLSELNMRMSQEANDLTSALKGNSKSQGDWGEMILETLLENSGLKRNQHFRTQESIRNADGAIVRPDVILLLPEQKEVIIDSKVSLVSYVGYCQAQDDPQRQAFLAAHVSATRNHIIELGTKSYQKLVNSPDFVIMFIPNEPAFMLALQNDNQLWHEAYQRGVILSSPTNLFAILRIVDDLWKRDSQSKNALEIARQGGDLYDKFVGFAETYLEIGKTITRSQEQYDRGLGQLSQGTGNLVRRAERLRNLGLKSTKKIPAPLVQSLEPEDQ